MQLQFAQRPSFSGILAAQSSPSQKIWLALIEELTELGCSKQAIALGSHISISTLNRLELGKNHPSPMTFQRLLMFYCHMLTQGN